MHSNEQPRHRFGVALLTLAMLGGCATNREPAQPQTVRVQRDARYSLPTLGQNLLTAESALKTAVAMKGDVEAGLAQTYEALQLLCKASFDELDQDQERYATAEARTNVLGSLVALLGSVTVYAPGKTVLMGIGMSSTTPGTVSGGITQFFSKKSAADKATLAILKNQLALTLDRYDAVEPSTDLQGTRRQTILARAKGICLGLSPAGAEAPPTPASGAGW